MRIKWFFNTSVTFEGVGCYSQNFHINLEEAEQKSKEIRSFILPINEASAEMFRRILHLIPKNKKFGDFSLKVFLLSNVFI